MKLRLLILLTLLSFGASAQRVWTSFGANGVQRSTTIPPSSAPDTLFRSNGGASGFVYWRSEWYNRQHFATPGSITDSIGAYLGATELANKNAFVFDGYAPSLTDTLSHQSEGVIRKLSTGVMINVYRKASSPDGHVSNTGDIYLRKSTDGGITWGTGYLVYSSVYDDRNLAVNVTDGDLVTIWFVRYDANTLTSIDNGFIYSTNAGLTTWSSYTTVATGISDGAPFGNGVKNALGEYLIPYYGFSICKIYSSTDGITWGLKSTMFSSPPFVTSEVAIAYVGSGKLMAIVRNETTGVPMQYTSTNNGLTWTYSGLTNIGEGRVMYAPSIFYDSERDVVVTMGSNRDLPYVDNKLFVYVNALNDVFSTTTGYELKKIFARPLPTTNTFTYGYPTTAKNTNGDYITIFSERTPNPTTNLENIYLYQFSMHYLPTYFNQNIPSDYAINNYVYNKLNSKWEATPSSDGFVVTPRLGYLSYTNKRTQVNNLRTTELSVDGSIYSGTPTSASTAAWFTVWLPSTGQFVRRSTAQALVDLGALSTADAITTYTPLTSNIFIKNQNSLAQAANAWINGDYKANGAGIFGTNLTVASRSAFGSTSITLPAFHSIVTTEGFKSQVAQNVSGDIASLSTTLLNGLYLGIGGREFGVNSYRLLGFGYNGAPATSYYPAYIGYQEKSSSGQSNGDLQFFTRSATTNVAPSLRLSINANGDVSVYSGVHIPAITSGAAGTDSLLVKKSSDNKIYKIPANYYSTASAYVPYTGATTDLNLGTHGIYGGFAEFNGNYAGANVAVFNNSSATGTGIEVLGGNASASALKVSNYSNTVVAMDLKGDGKVTFASTVTAPLVGFTKTLTASGTGVATTISVAHGLTGITGASAVVASPNTSAAAGYNYVTVDATNVSFFYTVAPALGTNNLVFSVTIK